MSRVTTLLALVAVLFLMPVAAQATAIPIMQNQAGAVIFADDFEGVSPGSAPVAPSGSGTWTTPLVGGSNSLAVSNAAAANEGSQFLRFIGDGGTSNCSIKAAGVAANSGPTDTISMQFAFRTPTGGGTVLYLDENNSSKILLILSLAGPSGSYGPSNRVNYHNGSAYVDSNAGATYTDNRWNTLLVTGKNGSATDWTISLNGGTPVAVGTHYGVAGIFNQFEISDIGTTYLDAMPAVPEPTTLALLATGLIGLLCYAWRKRR